LIAALLFAIFFASSSSNLHARPQLATFFFLALIFSTLVGVETKRLRLIQMWWLPLVFAMWANLHGGVLGGIATLYLVAMSWMFLFATGRASPIDSRKNTLHLVVIVSACSLAIFVTPYGTHMPRAWFAILSMDLPHLVIEHAPLNPLSGDGAMAVVACAVYGLVVASARTRLAGVSWWLPLVWFVLAWGRFRHASLFAITAFILLPVLLPRCGFVPFLERRGFFQVTKSDDKANGGEPTRISAVIATCLMVVSLVAIFVAPSRYRPIWVKPDSHVWPTAVRTCLDEFTQGKSDEIRVFNEVNYGGFLIYGYPRIKVFIDGRCELFGERFLRRYLYAKEDSRIVRGWADSYGIDAALVERGSLFDAQFSAFSDWTRRCDTNTARLYVRREHSQRMGHGP
jgi:hypothetical protein